MCQGRVIPLCSVAWTLGPNFPQRGSWAVRNDTKHWSWNLASALGSHLRFPVRSGGLVCSPLGGRRSGETWEAGACTHDSGVYSALQKQAAYFQNFSISFFKALAAIHFLFAFQCCVLLLCCIHSRAKISHVFHNIQLNKRSWKLPFKHGQNTQEGNKKPLGDLQAGTELLPDAVTSEAAGCPRLWSPLRWDPVGETHAGMSSSPSFLWFSLPTCTLAQRSGSLVPWCAWVCMATYTNVPGHHLNSSNFQLTQQRFFKMYDTWGKRFPNFESWGRFSSFLVGLVLAFTLRCKGSWNMSISLSLMGLSWSHSQFHDYFFTRISPPIDCDILQAEAQSQTYWTVWYKCIKICTRLVY